MVLREDPVKKLSKLKNIYRRNLRTRTWKLSNQLAVVWQNLRQFRQKITSTVTQKPTLGEARLNVHKNHIRHILPTL